MVTWGMTCLPDGEPVPPWRKPRFARWCGFRGWASAGPAATTPLRETPVPVHDLRVYSPVTPGVGGLADSTPRSRRIVRAGSAGSKRVRGTCVHRFEQLTVNIFDHIVGA